MRLCVTVAAPSTSSLRAALFSAFEAGADLVELRADGVEHAAGGLDVEALLAGRPGEVIFTCRRRRDGGAWSGAESERRRLWARADAAGVEWIDVEDDVAPELPPFRAARRLVSHHDLGGTPPDLARCFARAAGLGEVAKIAARPRGWGDVLRMLAATRDARGPVIGVSMGSIGRITRLCGGGFGSPWTYAAPDDGPVAGPGQVRLRELREVFDVERIGPATRLFAVLGDPIEHSLSPAVHNERYRAMGIDAVMLRLRVPSPDLPGLVGALQSFGFEGFAVTLPHKRAVLAQARGIDEVARVCGAANTLVLREDPDGPRWWATNTDLPAAMRLLADAAGGRQALVGRRALVLGAGGVARTIAIGLSRAGAQVCVTARRLERARGLAAELHAEFLPWEQRGARPCDVLVNGTPVGMSPDTGRTPMPPSRLPPRGGLVMDAVYTPASTRLLADARARGCTTVAGLPFFVEQAACQIRLLVGREPDRERMHQRALAELGRRARVDS